MTQIFSSILIAGFLISSLAFAENSESTNTVREFVKIYKTHPTPSEFLEQIREKLPATTYNFLKANLVVFDNTKNLPKISVPNDETLLVEYQGLFVSMNVASALKQIFIINGKTVDFSSTISDEQKWQKIMKALPKIDHRGALLEAFMPFAYADDIGASTLRVTGGAGLLTGVSLVAASASNPAGWILMAGSAFVWASGTCQEIAKQSILCRQQLKTLTALLATNKDRFAAYKAQRIRAACPSSESDPKDPSAEEKETVKMLNEIVHGQHEVTRNMIHCFDGSKAELATCIHNVSNLSSYLCMDTLNMVEDQTDPWAMGLTAKKSEGPPASKPKTKTKVER